MSDITNTIEHNEQKGNFPPFDTTHYTSQIFWLFVTFGILYFILSKILLPRLSGVIEERRNRIADDLDSVTRMQNEAEQAKLEYEKSLIQAKEKAQEHAETVKKAVQEEVNKEISEAEAEISRKQVLAETRIQKANQKAMKNVNVIAYEVAETISGKLSNRQIFNQATIKKTVDDVSKELFVYSENSAIKEKNT